MKHHFVIKLRKELAVASGIPDWLDFIHDKSRALETIEPKIDAIFSREGLKFWLTHEYKPAHASFGADERLQGLNRTYRLILQEDYDLPPGLVERIKLVPAV